MQYAITTWFMTILMAANVANSAETREWTFKVSLDGKEVGSQRFRLQDDQGKLRMETEADLTVKVLFLTVYRYWHQNVESWENGCLSSIESRTKVNGKTMAVKGKREKNYFGMTAPDDGAMLPECVMSFAYWNPRFLQEERLLNSQSGEYVEVNVSGPVDEKLTVRGESLLAQRYQLRAGDIDLQLWYSTDDRWLALESTVGGGRILSYELM